MDKAKKNIRIFNDAVRDSYNILIPEKPTDAPEIGTAKEPSSTYYNIDHIFDYDGSYKYEFAVRTPFNKLQSSKWSTFWSEQENPEYKIRLNT